MPDFNVPQERDVFLETLQNKYQNKLIAQTENLPYPVAGIKVDPVTSQASSILRRLGVSVRMHGGGYLLFDETKATELLKELGAVKDGVVDFKEIDLIEKKDFDNPVQSQVIAKKLQAEGVPVKLTSATDAGKKIYSLNYYGTSENQIRIQQVINQVLVSDFKNEIVKQELSKKVGIEGEFDYFACDSASQANNLSQTLKSANIQFGKHGSTVIYYDRSAAEALFKEMGISYNPKDPSVWNKLRIHECAYEKYPSQSKKFEAEAEFEVKELKERGVNAVQRGTKVICVNSEKATEYFSLRERDIRSARAKELAERNDYRQKFVDDILRQYNFEGLDEYIGTDVLESRKPANVKEAISKVGETATKVMDGVVEKVQSVHQAINETTQMVVGKIEMVKGGKGIIQAGRVMGKVAKVGGVASVALAPALDPKGTKEMIDDVTHLRFQKIIAETLESGVQIVLHPKETAEALYEVSKEAVQERYEGAITGSDYVVKTFEAGQDGLYNIADTLTYLGSKKYEISNAMQNVGVDVNNWAMEKLGIDNRLVKDTMTYEVYQKNPLGYIARMYNPVTQSASTGLRSDDTVYTVIERGDAKAMRALIERGDDVAKNIQGNYKDLNYNTHYTPYDTALGMAVAKGDMGVAFVLYTDGKNNINGINGLTKDTTFMSILKQLAPEEGTKEYYLGNGSIRHYTEKERNKHLLGQALVDDMIKSGKLDVTQENAQGKNAFLVAVETGNLSAAMALIEKGVDIQKTAKDGSNALHLCVHNQLMTHVLIQQGVDTNQVNQSGKTPLMVALEQGQNKVALNELLLASDAKGIAILMKSEKHATLLNDHLEKQPNLKLAILTSKNHPLKEGLLNSSDKNGNQMSNDALAQETGDKKAPDVVQTLAQSGASVQEQGEAISFIQRDMKQVG